MFTQVKINLDTIRSDITTHVIFEVYYFRYFQEEEW